MPARHSTSTIIATRAQVQALRSPARLQLVSALERMGPSSVTDLGERLGVPAESLYYHVHKLIKAGLVVPDHERPAGKRSEVVYRLVSRRIRTDPGNRSPAYLKARAGVGTAVLRAAERTLVRAVELGEPADLLHQTARLDADSVRRLRSMLDEVVRFLHKYDGPEGKVYSVTIAFSRIT